MQILVNQVGYDSGKEKRFVVQAGAEEIPTYFEVTDLKGKTFHRGSLERAGEINYWENNYWVGDFTDLEAEGRFIVRIGDISKAIYSHPFMIARDLVFEETGELAQRFFHYQRCGTEVEGWHGACHMDDGRMPDGSRLDVSGGWHDAGDYNK